MVHQLSPGRKASSRLFKSVSPRRNRSPAKSKKSQEPPRQHRPGPGPGPGSGSEPGRRRHDAEMLPPPSSRTVASAGDARMTIDDYFEEKRRSPHRKKKQQHRGNEEGGEVVAIPASLASRLNRDRAADMNNSSSAYGSATSTGDTTAAAGNGVLPATSGSNNRQRRSRTNNNNSSSNNNNNNNHHGGRGNAKMKTDMPPRPAKANSNRRQQQGGGGGQRHQLNAASSSGNGGGGADDAVPHVVRVTFLGVAGLLVRPPHGSPGDNGAIGGGSESSSSPAAAAATTATDDDSAPCSPASPDHPSLLLPLPPRLRAVASVSRSRTARGIPSGMSGRLACPAPSPVDDNYDDGGGFQRDGRRAIGPLSAGNGAGIDGIGINEIDVARNAPFDDDPGRGGGRRKRGGRSNNRSTESISPPSQLLHSRAGSKAPLGGGGNGVGVGRGKQGGPASTEGIEVVRPIAPGEASPGGVLGGARKLLGQLSRSQNAGGTTWQEHPSQAQRAEPASVRYVAVWDEGSGSSSARGNNGGGGARTQRQYVNSTNSLAFEAELRPSDAGERDGRGTPAASTTFAPKSFCVSVGLVPDIEGEGGGESMEGPTGPPPAFAIPVGFADLVINGDETLDGRRKQVDLPLSSLGNFVGSLPDRVAEGASPVPLIELTAEGLAGGGAAAPPAGQRDPDAPSSGAASSAAASRTAAAGATGGRSNKRKNLVKRMFTRRALHHAAAAGSAPPPGSSSRASPPRPYDGEAPRSIFRLGRAPNARERALFLDRYGVDPGGDAVVRIGLEVFPRGSELERVFRQKNKLRKKAAVASAGARDGSNRRTSRGERRGRDGGGGGRFSPSSSGSQTFDTADSRSLMDDYDDDYDELDSDCDDSVFSQSFFTLDSDASRTTWDESTMYTDALSSFNTMDDDSLSYTTGFTEYDKHRAAKASRKTNAQSTTGLFFANLLNCNGPTPMACGVDGDDLSPPWTKRPPPSPYKNIDMVAEAMASMSMGDNLEEEEDATAAHGEPAWASVRSVASMDTTTRANDGRRPVSPNSVGERGEELVLSAAGPGGNAAGSEGGGGRSLSPLHTAIPVEQVRSSVTIHNETSPLAMIQQRFAESQDYDTIEKSKRRAQGEEGHEFTLEEHQSSM